MLPYLIAGAIGFGIGKLFENGGETFMAGGRITTNEGIIESFLNSNREVRVRNLESVEIDDIMYLRNYRTFIAKRMGDKVKISSQKYSQTTSTITNRLKALAEKMGYSVEYVTEKEIYNFDEFVGGGEIKLKIKNVDSFDKHYDEVGFTKKELSLPKQDSNKVWFTTTNDNSIAEQLISDGFVEKYANGGETFMAGGTTNEDIVFEYPKDSNGRVMSWINVGTGNMEIASKTGTVGQVRDGHQLIVLKSETPNKVDYHILVDYLPEENKINMVRGKFNSEPSPKYQSYINDLFRMLKISQTTRDYQDEDIANQVYVKRYLINNFGNPPKGCEIKATELGVEIHFDSTNKMSSDWAMKIADKYGYPSGNFEMRYSSGNVPITYVDTSKIAKNTSKSGKGYFNFGETFMAGGNPNSWSVSDLSDGKYLGYIEFQDNSGEYHYFEIMETDDRLVFGGMTNTGFIESGYIEKDGFSTDETLQSLIEDLEVYYNDGAEYTSQIVFNERMENGGEVELETWRENGVSENEKMDFNKLTRSEVKDILKELGYNVTEYNFSKFHKKEHFDYIKEKDVFYRNDVNDNYAGGGLPKKRRRSASVQYGRSDTAVDKTRVGKPVGYRFSNAKANQLRKDPYAKPTEAQVKKYLGKGIYKENRKNRSDRDKNVKL